VGCYSVLPPSVHPSGHVYRWIVPLPEGELLEVNLLSCGFIELGPCDIEHLDDGVNRSLLRTTEAIEAVDGVGDVGGAREGVNGDEATTAVSACPQAYGWSEAIKLAIADTVPTRPGKRHAQVFELARALAAIPELTDADGRDLEPYVRRWHELALDQIRTKAFEETWIDFLKGWPNVNYPRGREPMAKVFERARANPLPKVAERYEQQALKMLVAVCQELQRGAGDGPFYLACRTAGRLLGVDHSTANRWLFLLTTEGVLEEVQKGDRKQRRASRFRYVGEP
jgi:hypothetical protein